MNTKGHAAAVPGHLHHHPMPQPQSQHRAVRRKLQGGGAAAAVPPAELSSAIAFLGETALNRACDILLAQSEALFGSANDTAGSKGGAGGGEGSDEPTDPKEPQKPESTESEEPKDNPAKESYVNQLSALHEKCKNAHDVIVRADEAGMLSDSPHGVGPHALGTPGHPSPMMHRASSMGIVGVKPPPSLHRGMSGSSTPSLLRSRGSFTGSLGGGAGGKQTMHRRTHSGRPIAGNEPIVENWTCKCGNTVLGTKRRCGACQCWRDGKIKTTLARGTSHGSEGGAGGTSNSEEEKSANPPPEVLNFLKALNAGKGAAAGPNMDAIKEEPPTGAEGAKSVHAATPAKRKARSPPPPPPSRPPPPPAVHKPAAPSNESSSAPRRHTVFSHVERAPPPPSKTPQSTPSATKATAPSETPEPRSTRSRRSTPSSTGTKASTEKMYGIGESVLVQMDGEKHPAIVKNVHCDSDHEEDGGGSDDVMYEVEFSNGDIWDVEPKDVFEDEDD